MKRLFAILVSLFIGALSGKAFAFPQMIAHGYPSCIACHVSPTGGGLLTPYGRSLSRELLSEWGAEGEEKPLYGAVTFPEWLNVGGDARLLQSYMNSPMIEEARLIFMQADAELGATAGKFQFVATAGYQNPMSLNSTDSRFISRRHYVMYAIEDNQFLRAGRFDLAYGIHWPDHFMLARRDLGWDEGSEAYRLEWSRIGESWQTFATVTVGRPDAPDLQQDRALTFTINHNFLEQNYVGFGGYLGKNDLGSRAVFGPTFALTPRDKLTLFGEVDVQKGLGDRRGANYGFIETLRLQYEAFQGLHLSLAQEYERMDLSAPLRSKQAYTLGAQWFFRPHVEVAAGWRKQKSSATATGFTDLLYAVLHYYI